MKEFKINKKCILGHSDVSPGRKKDPGEKFPWETLAKNKLSFWHNLDQKKIFNAIKNGAANSWQFTNRYPTLTKNKFNFGFSTELMTKDLKYVLQQAKKIKLNLNLTKSVFKKYKSLQNTIYKKFDTSSLIKSFNDQ